MGENFPDLDGAASTRFYAQNERRLFAEHFPPLDGLRIFKSDLWDEARNTRILVWAAGQGAQAFGVDISRPIVVQARAAFDREPLHAAVADIRALPFADASFDAVYSMGTIEHFRDSERALDEMVRVLRPGGLRDRRRPEPPRPLPPAAALGRPPGCWGSTPTGTRSPSRAAP